jgi:riboflavin kinase/FMN adenylyltransferase
MKLYEGLNGFHRLEFAVVTSGTFDGVHAGHQAGGRRVTELSKILKGESVLLTFWPHPKLVLNDATDSLRLLNTIEEKENILAEFGIDHLIKIPFTKEFAQTSSEDFIRNILVNKIGTKKLVIGYNHRFGRNREGSFENLVRNAHIYGFEVEEIPKHEVDHIGISSTMIRQALSDGDIDTAYRFLARPYTITGFVTQGDKLGRTIGFPTANIYIQEDYKLIPRDGIYAVRVELENLRYPGMMNIGVRPTVNGTKRRIEVHILDFDKQIYDMKIKVFFVRRIRDEKKFESLDALKSQLIKDRETVKMILT